MPNVAIVAETSLDTYTIHEKQELSRIQRFQDASLDRQPLRDIILPVVAPSPALRFNVDVAHELCTERGCPQVYLGREWAGLDTAL